ncbi:Monofunctional biosynthetic peptidoglycan transglycosylase [Sandaracinus amylolyticus]|uniref:Monofunctional biosynthetic peptidoglycan transglycosylase n=1 Tax=Sandaracinus amylolyticus TaxID=927083 RepID=A0A0F6W8L3_9BACT|nr:Monofunctional biosynthetic peptidoglycan transglycosylase [Sandaracinus amylolyticus]
MPGIVREEVVARAEQRGLRCSVRDTDVGLGSIVLRGVDLHDDAGLLRGSLGELEIVGGLFGLATSGLDAIERVEVRGGEVVVDASARRKSPQEAGAGDGGPVRVLPAIAARDVRAVLRDSRGELGSGVVEVRRDPAGGLEIVARDLVLGAGTSESTTIGELRVVASGSVLDRVEARDVVVEVRDREGEDDEGLLARARALRGASDEESGAQEGAGAAAGAFGFLGEAFEGRVQGLTVRRSTADGSRDVLTNLSLDVRRDGADAFRTRGEGAPDHGGRLGWDLRVEPLSLRAVGSIELRDVAVAVVEPLLPDALPLHRSEDARLEGALTIEGAGDALHATGRLAVRDLALQSERIAPAPIAGIALELEGESTFLPEQRRLEIARLRVRSGAAHVDVSGAVEWAPDHYLFDVRAEMPATRCNDAISAIPRDLLQEMAAFSLTGSIGGRIEARVDSRDLDATQLRIRVADGCRFEMVPPLADLSRFDAPFVHRVEEPDGAVFEMTTGPGTPEWTAIADISPFMLHAVLGHEDGGFFRHSGFSPSSIREALVRNLRAGRYVMGGSTISMQLVKNVFLRREKTLARKVQEVLLVWWIESAWPKERILELYLNVIEYGPGVYGIRNAAQHYFGVQPSELSPAQAAYLATILPNPKAYHSHWEQGALPSSWASRVARFIRTLGERERFDATAVDEGVREAESLQFHRGGEPPPVREFAGRTTPLPISGAANEVVWDEALDGMVAEEPVDEYE